MLAWDLEN